MEYISSRQNSYIKHLRALAASAQYRYGAGEYVCGGMKLLSEALSSGARIASVLWAGEPEADVPGAELYSCPAPLLEYASPLKSPQGPVFTVRIPKTGEGAPYARAIILDGVQNPGNVGAIIRTAAAFSFGPVILAPGCADRYGPKTVHGAMGALFKCPVFEMDYARIRGFLEKNSLALYGADPAPRGLGVKELPRENVAVAIGSEGAGLGAEIRAMQAGTFTIPMAENIESLNAAAAAAVIIWEIVR